MPHRTNLLVLSHHLFEASIDDDASPAARIWFDRLARIAECIGGRRYSREELTS